MNQLGLTECMQPSEKRGGKKQVNYSLLISGNNHVAIFIQDTRMSQARTFHRDIDERRYAMCAEIFSHQPELLGSLSNDDGDANENAISKYKFTLL